EAASEPCAVCAAAILGPLWDLSAAAVRGPPGATAGNTSQDRDVKSRTSAAGLPAIPCADCTPAPRPCGHAAATPPAPLGPASVATLTKIPRLPGAPSARCGSPVSPWPTSAYRPGTDPHFPISSDRTSRR